ncbi:pyridine nucleotide-disulfide oxidoreductase [Streptococcus pneumoniae]|nr:pyridine nucleotide-disulfide oxidoreductase [Streptococcus pneumoniae]MDA5269575.1 pyridine nucleotide-disulfide oxidoreductase [Streptococcus pneumoniae]OYL15307.1 pyridine nucleotide-disulfide oxidoreductase [Streptococcus pneumoniae]TNW65859.1 pyridine nucleotide-disulfide oxidoreductase [Streptococcus pneumoniae]TVW37774.1 pyridine nucleotide-disulfide oxidoreductase [Streptococcus pneumoniae]
MPIFVYHNIIKDNIVILFVFSHSVSLYKKAIHFEPLFLIYRLCYE